MTGQYSRIEETQLPQGAMAWIAHDDMVKNFDFDKLAGADAASICVRHSNGIQVLLICCALL